MRLAEIRRYPVKSLRGHSVREAVVERVGLSGDRRWMIIDQAGKFLTQRQHRKLAQIDAIPIEGGVELRHAQHGTLAVIFPDERAPQETVLVWRDTVRARIAGAASAYLSDYIGQPVRLAYLHDPKARTIDSAFGHADDRVSFADGFPLLITLTASLDDLNRRLAKPITMDRFRANLIIEGSPAWIEDTWRCIRIGALTLRIAKPCSRCAIPTLNPLTGEQPDGNEPLQTLASFRRDLRFGIMFGQNAIPDASACVFLGDRVDILQVGAPNVQFSQ